LTSLNHIFRLGVKELRSLWADKVLLVFVLVAFTALVYSGAKGTSRELHNAPIAFVDQDRSPLSGRLVEAFYGPLFQVAGDHRAGACRSRPRRRPLHLCPGYPAEFPA
jgi:ABC-2 type transport system permease protein